MRTRRSTILSGFVEELRASSLADVRGVVRDAEAAARSGRWVGGFVSYEAAPAFEAGLAVAPGDATFESPLAWFGVFTTRVTTALALPTGRAMSRRASWALATAREEYMLGIKSILDEIEVGSAYQVNLTSHLTCHEAVDARDLYVRLLLAQQPAYGALIELEDVTVVSASPELFFDWDSSNLCSRPMKGTAPRGRWPAEDVERSRGLGASAKDRAENVMIVDLIRNDMGKVARIGSVEATSLCEVEGYPHVWQMTSEVRCRTRDDVGVVDVFDAMFPCGSVTGAPKRSAMSIIASLETAPRGVYCGAVGKIGPSPSGVHAQFNVAIRTAEVNVRAQTARFGSGGGIVAASRAEDEYRELVLKARMLSSPFGERFRLLETFRWTPGSANGHVSDHLARMTSSAGQLGFRVPDSLDERVARKLSAVDVDARVRVLLSRDGRLDVRVESAPPRSREPVRLVIDDEPVFSRSVLVFHKTTKRDAYDRRRRRHRDADDVVMVNEHGECTETTTANLAVRVNGRWVTPPLTSGCLPGVERARLIDEGHLTEAVVTSEQLLDAEELAVINSLRGWRDALLI